MLVEQTKEPGSTNKSHEFRPIIVPNCDDPFFFSRFRGRKDVISPKGTFAFRMRLVKAAKASPHAKFYSLKAVNHPANSGGLQYTKMNYNF